MKLKQILALSLVLILSLGVLAGCAPKDPDITTSDVSKEETSSEKDTNKDVVDIELFGQKPESIPVVEKFIEMFEKENENIKITYTNGPDSGSVLLTRMASDEMPDMLNSYPAEDRYKTMFEDGLLLDLTDQEFMSNIQDSMLSLSEHNGKQFSLPITLSAFGLYYNVDLFEEHGQKPPTTYAEFIEVAEYFKGKGIDAMSQALKDNTTQLLERGSGVVDNENHLEFEKIAKGELDVKDSQALINLGEFMLDVKKYSAEDALGVAFTDAYNHFSSGNAAMVFTGTWALSTFKQNNPDFNAAMVPMPTITENYETKVPVNVDTAYSINANGPNIEEALTFFEFLSRTDVEQIYADEERNANLVKGVKNSVEEHKAMNDAIESGDTFLTAINFWPPGLREDLGIVVQQLMIDGDMDAYLKSAGEFITARYNERDAAK